MREDGTRKSEITRKGSLIVKIVFVTSTTAIRRFLAYRFGGQIYGQSNSITGPLILGRILKDAGHEVEVYEEYNAGVDYKKLIPTTDVFCFSIMTSTAPRAYELADRVHREGHAKVIIGGMHATYMPEETAQHADHVITGEGEKVILDVVEGRRTEKIIPGIPIENLDEVPFPDYDILKTPCKSANVLTTRGVHVLHYFQDVCPLPPEKCGQCDG